MSGVTNSLYISSDDKQTGGTNANFSPEILNQTTGTKQISIEWVEIQKTYYPIVTGLNDRLDFKDAVNTYFVVVP